MVEDNIPHNFQEAAQRKQERFNTEEDNANSQKQESCRVKQDLKIDQKIIDELNRKKQIKTVQNSNESSQESDSQVGSGLGLEVGKGLLKGANSKNEIGICTITNSNSDK